MPKLKISRAEREVTYSVMSARQCPVEKAANQTQEVSMSPKLFAQMAATLASPPTTRKARPNEDRDDELIVIAELRSHFSKFDCMPFPAGPVLPRQRTDQPPLVAANLCPEVRAAAALLALCELKGGTASSYTGQVRYAIAEWVARHEVVVLASAAVATEPRAGKDNSVGQDALFRPLLRMFHQIFCELSDDHNLLRDNHKLDRAEDRVESLIKDIQENYKNDSPIAAKIGAAFSAPRYRCACHASESVDLDSQDDRPLHPSPEERAVVKTALEAPLGEWQLLTLLFLKLLHGHLAYLYSASGRPAEAGQVFHPTVLMVLDAVVRTSFSALAPVAAGIARAMPDAISYMVDAGASTGVVVLKGLPKCFDPGMLEPEAGVVAQARRALNDMEGGGSEEFADWVDLTASLAHEVASVLADPHLAQTLDLSVEDFAAQGKLYESWKSNKHSMQERLARVAPHSQFRIAQIKPKLRRLFQYHGWMARHGVEALGKARETLSKAGVTMPCPIAPRSDAVYGRRGGIPS